MSQMCTCQWADDEGNPEVGTDPYIAELNEAACPVHRREAAPDEWARMDADERAYAAWEAGR